MKLSACVSISVLLFIHLQAAGYPPVSGPAAEFRNRSVLPPVVSRGDAAYRSPRGGAEALTDIRDKIAAAGQRGTWIADKQWEVLLNSVQAGELPELLITVANVRSCPAKRALRAALYSHWGEMDPAAAMRSVIRESDPATAAEALHALLGGWAHANADEVLAWCEDLPAGNIKLSAYLAAFPYLSANACAGSNVAAGRISRTARAALAAADQVADEEARWPAYQSILRSWAAGEPAAAARWAAKIPDPIERDALLEIVVAVWVRTDARDAGTFLATQDIPRPALDRIISEWAAADVSSLVEWTRHLQSRTEADRIRTQIVPQWLVRSPDEVAAFITTLPPDTSELSSAMAAATRRWIASDLPRLVALWRSLPLDATDRLVAGDVLQPLIGGHPDAAATLLEQLSPRTRRAIPLVAALETIGRSDAEALKRHLQAISGARDESAIRAAVCARLATSNPSLAAELTATAHSRKTE